jgi:hypothetical protein
VKVLLAQMVEGSVHTALNQTEKSFNSVGVDALTSLMPHVFPFGVIYHVM